MDANTHHLRAFAEMLSGNRISVIHALHWDDVRLSATIHLLQLKGIPIDSGYEILIMPFTGTKKRLKHWFINFDLFGDEEAARARLIQRKLDSIERYQKWPEKVEQLLNELEKLGYKPSEEQLELNLEE